MDRQHRLGVSQIVYIQRAENEYSLVRFRSMDDMRRELASHGVYIGRDVSIGREALIADGVHIGAGSVIGPEATLERGCRLGEHCRIDQDAFVGRYTQLGSGVHLGVSSEIGRYGVVGPEADIQDRCILHDNVHVGPGCILRDDTQIGSQSVIGHSVTLAAGTCAGRMVNMAPAAYTSTSVVIPSCSRLEARSSLVVRDTVLAGFRPRIPVWPVQLGGTTQIPESELTLSTPDVRRTMAL